MSFKFVKSERGNDMLLLNGYLHKRERKIGDKIIWKCASYSSSRCPGRAHTRGDEVVKIIVHTHVTDPSSPEVRQAINKMKQMAENTEASTQEILAAIAEELPEAAARQLPDISSLKRTIQRVRRKRKPASVPRSLVNIANKDHNTDDGEIILLDDSGSEMGEPVGLSNEEANSACFPQDPSTKDFIFQQTMYRIKDPKKSLEFYTKVMGMQLLQKLDFPEMKFSLYFMGYENPQDIPADKKQRLEWTFSRKATLELTHNWGTETNDECSYHNGNSEPRGFGHIGIMVPDVNAACERFEKLGVEFVKKPTDGKMKGIAFIKDPDGYWIEILNNKGMANF